MGNQSERETIIIIVYGNSAMCYPMPAPVSVGYLGRRTKGLQRLKAGEEPALSLGDLGYSLKNNYKINKRQIHFHNVYILIILPSISILLIS
ncbi:unnamed protein product [Rhizophagus irregularis]|uniref:Uncharacterized protein n=1 Tax=Rhizophagus irregularis TaxID=588596 RepID=A0A915YZ51_9GLOM|nr:unnamed protein product [Rhizophagus irregularis]CAB5185369.1 unnamed protein product [Rhizophagus irregularis]CAB5354250.1 unnamed protein product [Rhizophagus irregularis]